MNPRTAMKETIKFALINYDFDPQTAEEVADMMHDDMEFLEQFEEFIQEYIDDFGGNYGL